MPRPGSSRKSAGSIPAARTARSECPTAITSADTQNTPPHAPVGPYIYVDVSIDTPMLQAGQAASTIRHRRALSGVRACSANYLWMSPGTGVERSRDMQIPPKGQAPRPDSETCARRIYGASTHSVRNIQPQTTQGSHRCLVCAFNEGPGGSRRPFCRLQSSKASFPWFRDKAHVSLATMVSSTEAHAPECSTKGPRSW